MTSWRISPSMAVVGVLIILIALIRIGIDVGTIGADGIGIGRI